MERFFPLIYGKDNTPQGTKSQADDGKGEIAKHIRKNHYWEIIEIEVCKLHAFDNGLEGVRGANAMEVLRLVNLNLAI
jgi:hypothetical protein